MSFLENKNDIENINKLNFRFSINERFIYAKNNINKYFEFESPFLKVLKPIHITYNKKKTISKKYLILETNEDVDFNNEINDFIYKINKMHEISQEKIKEKSLAWFNTEFDDIGLDLKIRRPIEQHKNSEFIKISIPLENKELEEKITKLCKGDYILCNLQFKGLKVSSDFIVEDIEIIDFITQKEYDDIQNSEFINDSIFLNNEIIEENDLEEFTNIENKTIENNELENKTIENIIKIDTIENDIIENIILGNDTIGNNTIGNDTIGNDTIENIILENDTIENNTIENVILEKKSKKTVNQKSKENINKTIIKKNNITKNNVKNNVINNVINKNIVKSDLIKKISKKLIFT